MAAVSAPPQAGALPSGAPRVGWTPGLRRALLALVVFAGLVRLPIAFGRGWIGYDLANYLMIARNARAGLGWVQSALAAYAPKFHLLSFLLPGWLARLTGDELAAANLLFVLCGAATVALVAGLGGALFGPRVGLAAAALAAVAPVLTSLLVASISHVLFLPCFLGGLWLAWRAAEEGRLALSAAAGAAIGIGWWARADGLLVVPAIALFLFAGGLLLGRGRRAALAAAAVFVATFGLLWGGYDLAVGAVSHGEAAPHGPLFDFLEYPVPCTPTRDLASYSSFVDLALHEPRCVAARIVANAQTVPEVLLTWTGFPMLFLPLVGAALVAPPRWDRRVLAVHLLGLLAVVPLAFYLPFYYKETRYAAPYAAVGFLWCAAGLLAIGERLAQAAPRRGGAAPVVLVALAVAFLAAITLLHLPRTAAMGGREYVAAGRWIDAHAAPGAVVWTSQSQVAYYARRPWAYPPAPDDADAWRRLAAGSEVLLVDDQRHFAEKNPGWPELLAASGAELEPLYSTGGGDPPARVYRLAPALVAAGEAGEAAAPRRGPAGEPGGE